MIGTLTRAVAGMAALLIATTASAQDPALWQPGQLSPTDLATRLAGLEEHVDAVIAKLKVVKQPASAQREAITVRLGELAESLLEVTERAPFMDDSDRSLVGKTLRSLAAVLRDLRASRTPACAIRKLGFEPVAVLGSIALALSDRIRYVRVASHEG